MRRKCQIPGCVHMATLIPVITIPTENTTLPIKLIGEGVCTGHSLAIKPHEYLTRKQREDVWHKAKARNIRCKWNKVTVDFKLGNWDPVSVVGADRFKLPEEE